METDVLEKQKITKTILVVEDNNVIRSEVCDIFTMENYNVIEASNGLDGYIKAINELPDIIISDLMMPVLDGFKMYKQLKNNKMTEGIPIIFLSALSSDEDIRKGMNLGADDYLLKPIMADDLILATESKLEKYSKINSKIEDLKINITKVLYHELNTPLNGIIGFSDYLKTCVHDIPKENVQKIVENIYESGMRLHKLVKKYLCYAELKMKSVELAQIRNLRDTNYIDTQTVFDDIINSPLCEKRKDDFKISISPFKLKIDKKAFETIIEELIENAIKFSKPGKKIFITSKLNNGKFEILIKNEGTGLTLKQIKQINDFSQFDKSLNAQNGSGIGLSIVRLIADIYNAKFEIKSVPNISFTVVLTFNSSFRT